MTTFAEGISKLLLMIDLGGLEAGGAFQTLILLYDLLLNLVEAIKHTNTYTYTMVVISFFFNFCGLGICDLQNLVSLPNTIAVSMNYML